MNLDRLWQHLSLLLLVFFFAAITRIRFVRAQSSINGTVSCSSAYTFTSRQMGANLQSVLATLVQDQGGRGQGGGFRSTSSGNLGDTIYGLVQCRGDTTAQQCSSCAQSAATILNSTCVRNSTRGGRIYLDLCFFRYEDHFFSSTLDIVSSLANCSTPSSSSSSAPVFQSNSDLLVEFLRARVPPSERKFQSAVAGIGSAAPAYGLAQCIPDLSAADCAACLAAASNVIASTCGATGGGGVCYYASCTLFFQGSQFFEGIPINATLPSDSNGTRLGLVIGLPVAGVAALLLVVLGFWLFKRRRRRHPKEEQQVSDELNELQLTLHRGPVTFSYDILRRATDDFADANKLGEGGFGAVFKGTFGDGTEVAIKKLSVSSRQGEQQFLNEVSVIGSVQHRNLVRLLGCCLEGTERILVYEFLKNNSLEKVLLDDMNSREENPRLSWETRYNILLGTARGLTYLHEDSQVRIVHRDIKPSNILLDEAFEAKISDFGLARLYGEEEATEIITTKIAGTYGYMAPEYAFHGHLSEKADVFSFGVVVLETLAGRKNRDVTLPGQEQYLLEWAWQLHSEGLLSNLLDRKLVNSTSNEEEGRLVQAIHIALMCTQVSPQDRPCMSHVVAMLSGHSNVHVPLTATFDVRTVNPRFHSHGATSSSNSHSAASDPKNKASRTFSTPPEPR